MQLFSQESPTQNSLAPTVALASAQSCAATYPVPSAVGKVTEVALGCADEEEGEDGPLSRSEFEDSAPRHRRCTAENPIIRLSHSP